ncbi:axonemal dynein light intermediate polypeptide 1-like [Erpetoichthys calabaricus]|uniref:axonemal dynein light intermediate polypeptide 1-like n=1 Tax=Erpetoichthys calabaricus TaxID=27687 RepID=UPI00223460B7|nr:axonemal dynein light intermediate polypeptide 1-like [Erpetoichthys calabaricus]
MCALIFSFDFREWMENNKQWVQYVSASPSGRLDVIHLLEDLQLKLVERNAHELGLCPVRQELYKDCFDEIIRQVTVGCAERGQLLMRVREECEKIIATYQTLYESSMAYCMRKALQAEQDRIDLAKKISELESDKRDLERLLNEQRAAFEALEKSETDRRHTDEKKHSEEIDFFKQTIKQLKGQLEGFSGPKKTK